jgi:Flp pilus assembly protein TadD
MQTSSSRRSPRLVLGLCLLPALLGCNRAPKATVERPFLDAAVEVASPQPAEAAQPVTYGEAPRTASPVVKAEETVTDHVLRAAELARRGFATEAAAELRTAATLAPNDPRIAAALGRALHEAGDLGAAIDAYRQSLRLDPNDDEARFGLASAYLGRKDAQSARKELEGLALRHTNDPRVQKLLALAREGTGDAKAALDALKQVAEAAPEDRAAQLELGNARALAGDSTGAADALEKAAKLTPEDAAVQLQLGTALAQSGKLEDAEAALRRATSLAPGDARAWRNLASVLEQRGDAEGAARVWESMLKSVNNADPQGKLRERIGALRTEGLKAPPSSGERGNGQAGGDEP